MRSGSETRKATRGPIGDMIASGRVWRSPVDRHKVLPSLRHLSEFSGHGRALPLASPPCRSASRDPRQPHLPGLSRPRRGARPRPRRRPDGPAHASPSTSTCCSPGREPTEEQRFFLDLLLVAIAEHGMMPTNVAARMTLAADPGSLQGAVAAGILGCGPGHPRHGRGVRAAARAGAGGSPPARRPPRPPAARAADPRAPAARLPGFGHPVHRPLDPRAERILELADERGVSGPHVALARAFRDAVAEAWGKPLTMNVSMPIAAVLLDLGFAGRRPSRRSRCSRARPACSRTWPRSRSTPIGFLMAGARRGRDRLRARRDVEPEVETRPWDEQLALDDAAYREQLAYLFERSAFYREKLGAAGIGSAEAAGGLADIGAPAAHREARAARRRDAREPGRRAPLRGAATRSSASTRRAARPARRATSRSRRATSTTGSRARRAATRASGVRRGPAHRLDLQRRPVRGRRGARGVRPHRPLPHPGRHRQHRAADARDRAARRRGGGAHAVLRRLPDRVGGRARLRPRGLERRARARRGRARRRRAGLPRAARGGLGRAGDRGDGHRRHRRLALGRVRGAGRHAPRRARLRPRRADRPRDAATRVELDDGATRRARAHAPAPPRGAAAALPHARPRRGPDEPVRLRPHRPARPLHRPHRRHADRARRQRLPVGRPRGRAARSRRGVSGHILVRPRAAGREAGAAAAGRASSSRATPRPTPRSPTRSATRLRSVLVVQTRVELVPWGTLQRSEYKSKLVERA